MAKAYSKEDVVNATLMRFEPLGQQIVSKLRAIYYKFYDENGKDVFRTYASVTPIVMKEYFEKNS